MTIDPVVLLAEELRSSEFALDKAMKLFKREGRPEHGEMVSVLLATIRRNFGELCETAPTSVLGASELLRIAAQHMPFSHSRYATHLHTVADRLAAGERLHADLVWLRAMQAALTEGQAGEQGGKAAPLLGLAIQGASRPVTVYRAVQPVNGNTPWQSILSGWTH